MREEKKPIVDATLAADLLVVTSPTYCLYQSASLKAFVDLTFINWIPHHPQKPMFKKRAVVISTAAGAGMKSAAKDIKQALFYQGVPT